MKKTYMKPVFEKIAFDYKIQTEVQSPPPSCYGSVINIKVGTVECGEGTPGYIGWNNDHPGDF